MADVSRRMVRVVVVGAVLVATAVGCGSGEGGSGTAAADGGREPGSTSTGERTSERSSTTPTTEPPPDVAVGENDLPFVTCQQGEGLERLADLSVIDLDTKAERRVLSGQTNVCNGNDELTLTQFTASRKYLVTLWLSDAFGAEPSIEIIDVASGEHATVTKTELDAWATAQHGTGLGAQEDLLQVEGFSRSGDGTFYFSRYDNTNGVTTYYSQKVTDFAATSGTVAPTALPDTRWCYRSTNWSPDGTTCVVSEEGSMGDYMLRSDLVEAVSGDGTYQDQAYDHELAHVDWLDSSSWMDANTLVGDSDRSVSRVTAGSEQAETLYEIEGDRYLTAWGHSPSGRIFMASPTPDGTSTEVYELVAGSPEPVLFTTIGGHIAPIGL